MSGKKVGIIICAVCILLALGVLGLSKVHITKKEKPSPKTSVSADKNSNLATSKNEVQSAVSDQKTQPVESEPSTEVKAVASEQAPTEAQQEQMQGVDNQVSQPSGDSNTDNANSDNTNSGSVDSDSNGSSKSQPLDADDIMLDKIVAEDKLSYSGAEQVTEGYVADKSCYLSGSQVVYCLTIDVTMGTAGQKVHYFCTHSVYESVEIGEKLSVTYKRTTQNTFALMSAVKSEVLEQEKKEQSKNAEKAVSNQDSTTAED